MFKANTRIISALLAMLMILACLVSCNPNTPVDTDGETDQMTDTPTGDTSNDTSGEDPNGDIKDLETHELFKDGVPQYVLVRPDVTNDNIIDVAKEVYSALCSLATDKNDVEFTTDMSLEYLKTKQHDPTAKEILIGMTNYDETETAIADLGYGEYIIKTVGNKIVITGWSDGAVRKAADEFIKSLKSASDKSNVSLSASSIAVKKTYNELLNKIPTYDFDNTEFKSTYYSGDDCYLALVNKATESTHSEYLTKLENEGYKKYTDNNINNNLFATYVKDDLVINASFYPVKKEERIIIEELGDRELPALESENNYKKVCESVFLQVGVAPDLSADKNGMCFIYRLEDGTFIIYDGGHLGEKSGESNLPRQNARRIYELMKEYAPDPSNIVVKAWIITHGHSDHVNASRDFVKDYSSKVTIERFLVNFPAAEQANNTTTGTRQADDLLAKLKKYSPSTKLIKIHPGYKFYFANAELEFLYTLELYAPSKLTYYNTSSLVSTVTICGQKFMMTGDMSEDANGIIRSLYGKTLKSDFVQVAHHGYQGGSTQFYSLVDPTWAFWPINSVAYETLKLNARNEYMFKEGTNLKQTFVAFFQTTEVKLPFDGTNYTVTDNKVY